MDSRDALRRFWGYDTFRPRQEEIISSLTAGRDVAAVLPTGGGKSLCYQLAAVLHGGTAVVVSPLIALMDDQVRQLAEMGIPAAVLNSTLNYGEQYIIQKRAIEGAYRLLYLSPERLVRDDTLAWLLQVKVAFFVIDEAHCISEWGHDFRPEYRQLLSIRGKFPNTPIAAFTASATKRVRRDILDQLGLRDPDRYILSFFRPNLRYHARQCKDAREQQRLLTRAFQQYQGESVIVYAPTIREVEDTADRLGNRGIDAVPYHGQMDAAVRKRNQDRWMSDEVRVLVGTIAFGLGINKPGVRAVIHLSLPKSLEQYYQESGRAGRDGEPADCVLLWRRKDIGLQAYFINEISGEEERKRSWWRLKVMRQFAEGEGCRPRLICTHFGEEPRWAQCGQCDNCGNDLAWFAERAAPAPVVTPQEIDAELLEWLRAWRRKRAYEQAVAAYVVLPDVTLRALATRAPREISELWGISGLGTKRIERYGNEILEAVRQYQAGARVAAPSGPKESPRDHVKRLLAEGKTFEDISRIRQRTLAATIDLVSAMIEDGDIEFQESWIPSSRAPAIREVAEHYGLDRLKTIKEMLPAEVTYEDIRLVVAALKAQAR